MTAADKAAPSSVPLQDRIQLVQEKIVFKGWSTIRSSTFRYLRSDGEWQQQTRETYDRGHGAALLLYNRSCRTVILTRQLRYACVLAGYGELLVEVAAGMLDDMNPEECIKREAEEETGYQIHHVEKVCEAFTTPGSATEKIHFFMAEYDETQRTAVGGGKHEEGEDIEVVELPFVEAYAMIRSGGIVDTKTILLLQHAALTVFADCRVS